MNIGTSALIAVLTDEEGRDAFLDAIIAERGGIPAPARVEFLRVAGNQRFGLREKAKAMLAGFERGGCATLAFTADHAKIAIEAEPRYGSGNRHGGPPNLLALIVYAVAKERGQPFLCTRT